MVTRRVELRPLGGGNPVVVYAGESESLGNSAKANGSLQNVLAAIGSQLTPFRGKVWHARGKGLSEVACSDNLELWAGDHIYLEQEGEELLCLEVCIVEEEAPTCPAVGHLAKRQRSGNSAQVSETLTVAGCSRGNPRPTVAATTIQDLTAAEHAGVSLQGLAAPHEAQEQRRGQEQEHLRRQKQEQQLEQRQVRVQEQNPWHPPAVQPTPEEVLQAQHVALKFLLGTVPSDLRLPLAKAKQLAELLPKAIRSATMLAENLPPLLSSSSCEQAPAAAASNGGNRLTLLTFNIWYYPLELETRMRAIAQIIQAKNYPDFILLQEMTAATYLLLATSFWWFNMYESSGMPPLVPSTAWNQVITVTLARRDRVYDLKFLMPHRFEDSIDGRDVKIATGRIRDSPVCVGNIHLEHFGAGMRHCYEAVKLMDSLGQRSLFLAGDTNWFPGIGGPYIWRWGWLDAWLHVHGTRGGSVPSATWCPRTNGIAGRHGNGGKGARFDRVFVKSSDWEALSIELVGTDHIPGLTFLHQSGKTQHSRKEHKLHPSDHFGLYAVFGRRQA